MTPPLRWDWTSEREALLRERWPTETPSGEIVRALKALPSHIGTHEAAIVKAGNMGLRRMNGAHRISNLLPSALTGDIKLKERIAELWAEELSTAEIGRRCGITKNKVVGLSRRMGLPRRQSPVASNGVAIPLPVRAAAELAAAQVRSMSVVTLPPAIPIVQTPAPPPRVVPPRGIPEQPAAPLSAHANCQFPLWPHHVRVPRPALFCGKACRVGESWCPGHRRVVFTRHAEAA